MSASPTDRFRRVDAVFDAVLDLPAADQTAFIDRACGDDSELRAEVIRLLHAYRRAGAFLDRRCNIIYTSNRINLAEFL